MQSEDCAYAYFNLKLDEAHKIFKISNLKVCAKFENLWKNVFNLENIDLIIDKDQIKNAFEIYETIKLSINSLSEGRNFLAKTEKYIKIFRSRAGHYLSFSIDGRTYEKYFLEVYLTIFTYKNNKKNIVLKAKCYEQNQASISTIPSTENIRIPLNNTENNINIKNSKVYYLSNDDMKYLYSDIKINNIPFIAKKISSKIFGLTNLGNTCFLNSILQILVHSPIFVINFLNDIHQFKPNQDTLAYALFNFLMDIYSKETDIFSPSNFVNVFINKCNLFRLGEQSDSQRFFRNLASILENEFGQSNTCIRKTFEIEALNRNLYFCEDIYCGKTNYENENKQRFYNIFVSVSNVVKESSINDLLWNTYMTKIKKSEKLCKCNRNLTLKRQTFFDFNEYLSINIQKVNIDTRTINQIKIKINDICIDRQNNIYYTPYAINLHDGGMDFGHYYSFVKININKDEKMDGEWFCFSDSKFAKTNFQESSDKILNVFYKKKN